MEEEGVYVNGRAEIDTRRPFRSVKEAVLLFGETVLVGGFYANKRNEAEARKSQEKAVSSSVSIQPEIEETKQMLDNARKEGMLMVTALTALKEELQSTRKELQRLLPTKTELKHADSTEDSSSQRRRCVRFAKPHITEVIAAEKPEVFEKKFVPEAKSSQPAKKNKKKTLLPVLGIIFSSKKDRGK